MTLAERRWITLFIMLAAIMNMIDTTIAAVALPHIQGTTNSSREEVTWVVTSYIIAIAVMMPLSGWLAARFGTKQVLLGSVAGFTVFSILCGVSTTVEQLVVFRLFQGLSGAPMISLSQSILLDAYPREEHGKAMTIFGIAGITGPIAGPVLGGWIVDSYSWGWVFLINAPAGVISFFGLWKTMRSTYGDRTRKFNVFPFSLLALAICAFQLMLDRGEIKDWFDSPEILIEAAIAASALIAFVVHSATSPRPFFTPAMLRNRNLVLGTLLATLVAFFANISLVMLPEMMSRLMGHSMLLIGLVMIPRGLGTLVAAMFVNQLMRLLDIRLLLATGFTITAASFWMLARLTIDGDDWPIMVSGFILGIGINLMFVPMATLSFETLPGQYRAEASGLNTLTRFVGIAGGISILQSILTDGKAIFRSQMTERMQMENLPFSFGGVLGDDPASFLATLDHEVTRQAAMISFLHVNWLTFVVAMLGIPLAALFRRPKPNSNGEKQ